MKKAFVLLMMVFGLVAGTWAWDSSDCPKPEDQGGGETSVPTDTTEKPNGDQNGHQDSGNNQKPPQENGNDGGKTGHGEGTDGTGGNHGSPTGGEGQGGDTGTGGNPTGGGSTGNQSTGGGDNDSAGQDGNTGAGGSTSTGGEGGNGSGSAGGGSQGQGQVGHNADGEGGDNTGGGNVGGGENGNDGTGNGPGENTEIGNAIKDATGMIIDTGLGKGKTVLAIQDALKGLAEGLYNEKGAPSAEDIVNQALQNGLFGGSGESIGIDESFTLANNGLGESLRNFIADQIPEDPWGTIVAKAQKKLESWATNQLNNWIGKHPVLQKWFGILGINGEGIMNDIKNIWGILTGEGTLADKLGELASYAQNRLCDMVSNAIRYGMQKLTGWLSDIATQVTGKIVKWITGIIQRLFGINIPTDLIQGFQQKLAALAGKGIAKVMVFDPEIVVGPLRPGGSHGGGGGGGTTVLGTTP